MFEETDGIRFGDKVELSGEMLSVSLGPGLLGTIYDGCRTRSANWPSSMASFSNAVAMWRHSTPAKLVGFYTRRAASAIKSSPARCWEPHRKRTSFTKSWFHLMRPAR